MHLRNDRRIKKSFILMIAALTIAGCGGKMFTYKGDKVTQNDLIVPLEEGNQQGVWKTNELAVHYQYIRTYETMKITGSIEVLGGFATGFPYINHLPVYLLFLDDQGIVIENFLIFTGESNRSIPIPRDLEFEKQIPIPGNSRSISFAYEGILTGEYDIGHAPNRQW